VPVVLRFVEFTTDTMEWICYCKIAFLWFIL